MSQGLFIQSPSLATSQDATSILQQLFFSVASTRVSWRIGLHLLRLHKCSTSSLELFSITHTLLVSDFTMANHLSLLGKGVTYFFLSLRQLIATFLFPFLFFKEISSPFTVVPWGTFETPLKLCSFAKDIHNSASPCLKNQALFEKSKEIQLSEVMHFDYLPSL